MVTTTMTTKALSETTVIVQEGAAPKEDIYEKWTLFTYDNWVLGVVNTWAWGCGTNRYLLPQFKANVGQVHHLDVGVGTGYYLLNGGIPKTAKLTLLDNERGALEMGLARCGRPDARGVIADILRPLPVDDKFDSISMYYLLHCLHATPAEKCNIFKHIRRNMTPDGVIHGANVLAQGVRDDGRFSAHVRRGVLKAGIMYNLDDTAYEFEHALRENFREVNVRVIGSVFLFRAKGPKIDRI